jgi:hypothetical protein
MAINYEDERLAQVEQERQDALDKATATYTGMMEKSQQLYQEQIDATKAWEEQQKELQQKQTDFAIDQTQKQKQEAEKAYQKEQSAAYADYQKEKNAYGVNAEQTDRLAEVLDRNEAFADIAKNADKITDERLIDLAIAEPEAVEFVAGSVKADGSTQPYDAAVPQGEYPKLYTFDPRWGYATYADGIIGSTGSGPVALSIASMGLSGKTTYDPATIAQAVTSAKLASGTTGMDDSFLTNHASEAGLAATSVEASSDGIYIPLAEDGVPVVIKLKSDSGIGSNNAHWAVVISLNSDNSITVYDPTSAIATSHTWSLGAVASKTDTAYSVTVAAGSAAGSDANANADTSLDGTGEDTGEATGDESA